MCASLYCLTADCCVQNRLQAYSVTENGHHVCSVLKWNENICEWDQSFKLNFCLTTIQYLWYWKVTNKQKKHTTCTCWTSVHVDLFPFTQLCRFLLTARKITIKKGLADLKTTERETASFEVELSHPDVTGTWLRNGVQLKPTNHFRMSAKGHVHSLTISNLSVEDTGTFTFSVEHLKTSARLVVKGRSFRRPFRVRVTLNQ